MDKGDIIVKLSYFSQFTLFNANRVISVVSYFSTRDAKKYVADKIKFLVEKAKIK